MLRGPSKEYEDAIFPWRPGCGSHEAYVCKLLCRKHVPNASRDICRIIIFLDHPSNNSPEVAPIEGMCSVARSRQLRSACNRKPFV